MGTDWCSVQIMTTPPDDFMETALEMPGLIGPDSSEPPAAPPKAPDFTAVASQSRAARSHDPVGECIIRFTDELRLGMRPNIEAYLSEVAPPWRDALFTALLRAELESQSDSDEPLFIFRGQYLDRFPDRKVIVERLLSELEARISTVSHSDPVAGPVETFAAPRTSRPGIASPAAAVSASSGTMLERFQLLRELGAGANGKVFLARDPKLGRDVAIKIPHPERLRSPHDVERFLRTARAAAQLRHENLCPIYEINDVPGNYFLVMAFIKGQPLSYYLTDHKRLPIRQALLITKMLATAMIEPHQKGIVHRDLKPDNIQIDEDRRAPVIMDFGLARFDEATGPQLTQDGQLLGTPYYMSPEQALGDNEQIGPASDLYSLGVILYEMLTGQR
ncbi:MAG: serine/threonine protein kinase, partial [Planctomycetota bacterium]